MTYPTKLYLIAVGAIIILSAGTASAQLQMPGIDLGNLGKESRPLDPEQEAKRKAVDDAYKSTMEKLPDQKKSNDPWGNIRSTTKTTPKQR
ncbi:MAG TPA: hypothetical protein VM822_17965 [Pseudolabrys sp.]|nr:hypothetical protein [Pseudolabrys sp.]